MNDATLVAGLKSGDEKARIHFWRTYWGVAYPICVRILGGSAEATDIAVDLLTDFMTHFVQRLEEPKALRTYVRLMAIRRAQEASKRRRRKEPLLFEPVDDTAPSPEEMAHWKTLAPFLDDCLVKLTPKARQALRLKYGQQLNNVEIGQMIGGSKQYISRLVLKCLDVLRDCIEWTAGKEALKER